MLEQRRWHNWHSQKGCHWPARASKRPVLSAARVRFRSPLSWVVLARSMLADRSVTKADGKAPSGCAAMADSIGNREHCSSRQPASHRRSVATPRGMLKNSCCSGTLETKDERPYSESALMTFSGLRMAPSVVGLPQRTWYLFSGTEASEISRLLKATRSLVSK